MMWAWSFACRTVPEVAALLTALGKHRYVREVDHRVHRVLDLCLADHPLFRRHAAELASLRRADPEFDLASRDPRLWRLASLEEIVEALTVFWSNSDASRLAQAALRAQFHELGLEIAGRAPFASDPEEPEHPPLIELSWSLLPIVDLDAERHAGALGAMLEAAEEVDVASPIEQEGPELGAIELLEGAPRGVLVGDFLVWSEPPYAYADYVFRGASKMARLVDPPEGQRDLDDESGDELVRGAGRLAQRGRGWGRVSRRGLHRLGPEQARLPGQQTGPIGLRGRFRKGLDRQGPLSRVRVP